jgi:hypothetical protein
MPGSSKLVSMLLLSTLFGAFLFAASLLLGASFLFGFTLYSLSGVIGLCFGLILTFGAYDLR